MSVHVHGLELHNHGWGLDRTGVGRVGARVGNLATPRRGA